MRIKSVLPAISVPHIPDEIKANVLSWLDGDRLGDANFGLVQLLMNGNFVNTTGWGKTYDTFSVANNILTVTGDGTGASPNIYKPAVLGTGIVAGDKYYFSVNARATNASVTVISLQTYHNTITTNLKIQSTPIQNQEYLLSGIFPATTLGSNLSAQLTTTYTDAATANSKSVEVRNFRVFNLTAIFGAGNEPTAAEMDDILANHEDRYWEGNKQVCCNPSVKRGILTQILVNGNFANGMVGWSLYMSANSMVSGHLVNTANGTYRYPDADKSTNIPLALGKQFAVKCKLRAIGEAGISSLQIAVQSSGGGSNMTLTGTPAQNSPVIGTWYTLHATVTVAAGFTPGNFIVKVIHAYPDIATSSNKAIEIEYVSVADVVFGTGNEPTDAELETVNPGYFEGAKTISIPLATPKRYYWSDSCSTIARQLKSMSQLIANGNFANGTTGWVGIDAVNNGIAEKTAMSQYANMSYQLANPTSFRGHKLYMRATFKANNSNVNIQIRDSVQGSLASHTSVDGYETKSVIRTIDASTTYVYCRIQDDGTSGWTKFYVHGVICLDLTAIFGVGNEPSTAQMDAIIAYMGGLYWEGSKNVIVNPGDASRFPSWTIPNELVYNTTTWSEWAKDGATGDATGLEFTADGSTYKYATLSTVLKNFTKYGLLYNVVSSTITDIFGIAATSNTFGTTALASTVGNQKMIATTLATVTTNVLKLYIGGVGELAGHKLKLKDIRLLELPAGSEIEFDFNNMSADQLAIKYPMGSSFETPYRRRCMKLNGFAGTPADGWNKVPYIKDSLLAYNPATWAEWTKNVGNTVDPTGVTFDMTQVNLIKLNTNVKTSTKYGILFNVASNSIASQTIYGKLGDVVINVNFINIGDLGNKKLVVTTGATIINNRIEIERNSTNGTGVAKMKNIRLFELPVGSQIETDFNTLTADQLNAKYPFEYVPNPPMVLKGDAVDSWIGRAELNFIPQDGDFSYVCGFSPSADNIDTRLGYSFTTGFSSGAITNFYFLGGNLTAQVVDRGASNVNITVAQSVLASKYYIVTMTYTQADKKIRLYVNGALIGTSAALTTGHSSINYIYSYRSSDGLTYTAQRLGFEAWFNKCLSDSEVKKITSLNRKRFRIA